MKFKLSLISFLLIAQVGFAGDTTSIQMGYLMDEASGTRADSSGNSRNLTANGTGGVGSAAGVFNLAADLEASDSDYLTITDPNVELNTGNATWVFWYNPETTFGVETYMNYKGGGFGSGYAFIIADGGGGTLGIYFDTASAATYVNASVDTPATWHHACVRFDDTANTITWGIDGVDVETDVGVTGNPTATTTDFDIGRAGANGRYFDGLIDDFAIFTRALSNAECNDLKNNGLSQFISGGGASAETTKSTGIGFGNYQIA
jgi:hypothetical protein